MQLSQEWLNVLASCPRKLQQICLDIAEELPALAEIAEVVL